MIDAEHALDEIRILGRSAAEASFLHHYRGNPAVSIAAIGAATDDASPVDAVANHGRWIAECPSGDGGAQFASREDPRFLCVECLNAAIGGLWRPVTWPDEVSAIEDALGVRPTESQNWTPEQTVADLIEENEAN